MIHEDIGVPVVGPQRKNFNKATQEINYGLELFGQLTLIYEDRDMQTHLIKELRMVLNGTAEKY
uniref:Uncharacterized protein n=1 Tax=Romanomermis culicivorax TaxID=13658 RepID=A0A915J1Y0_ROMCU